MNSIATAILIAIRRGYPVKYFITIFFLFVLTIMLGCSSTGPHSYTSPAIGLGYIKSIAVLPLENFSKEKGAAERTRELLITRLLGLGLYEIVEQGELHRFLRDEVRSKEKALIDQTIAKRMAREFAIQAYISGSIDDYREIRNGSYTYPVIAATLRMVDIKTGQVIWQASADESGYSTAGRLFGLSSEGTNKVLFRLIDKLLRTMGDS